MTTLIRADLGQTRPAAKQIIYSPAPGSPITATNVQDAIDQSRTVPPAVVPTPVTASPYTVLSTDTLLYVNVAGPVTINLPTAASRSGIPLEIKDVSGAASTNNITIDPNGAQTIDGLSTLVIASDFGAFKLGPDATDWKILT